MVRKMITNNLLKKILKNFTLVPPHVPLLGSGYRRNEYFYSNSEMHPVSSYEPYMGSVLYSLRLKPEEPERTYTSGSQPKSLNRIAGYSSPQAPSKAKPLPKPIEIRKEFPETWMFESFDFNDT